VKSYVLFVLAAGALAASVLLAAAHGNENTIQQSKKLEGSWSVTSAVRNRNELPAERLANVQAIFRDGRFAFTQGDKALTEGTFQIDPAKTPRTIDLTTIDANGNEKTTLAIYDLAEDMLRICGAQPGVERPSEFVANDGSGHTLTTFQRVK
jgi:uncharacterized protein (TIGR03067 family)